MKLIEVINITTNFIKVIIYLVKSITPKENIILIKPLLKHQQRKIQQLLCSKHHCSAPEQAQRCPTEAMHPVSLPEKETLRHVHMEENRLLTTMEMET
ncbi:hypothetical protein Hanom_Chr10g00925401 [Helianthus anomalus]